MGPKLLLILALLAMAMVAESANASWVINHQAKSCTAGEHCLVDDETELLMDSETSRRQLAQQRRHISYGALKANNVPCNRRGRSYYNCQQRGRANPYHRGCTVITHCQRFTS